MATLDLDTQQASFMTAIDADMESAFAEGTVMPGGTPNPIPPYDGYAALPTDQKDLAKNAMKPILAALLKRLDLFTLVLRVLGAGGEPAYVNGFATWADANYSDGVVRFYKTFTREVAFEGLVRTPVAGTVAGLTMFTLPVGCRPGGGKIFTVPHNDTFATIEVLTTGEVKVRTAMSNNGWFSMDGVRFRVNG